MSLRRVEICLSRLPARLLATTLLVAIISGCATTFSPQPLEAVPFKSRAQMQSIDGLSVSAALPTRDEVTAIYGVDLGKKHMQVVWIEVRNDTDETFWLLPTGIDPAYFSVAEAQYAFRNSVSTSNREALGATFDALQFRNPVPTGETVSGFILVNRDEGFKAVDVDLVARETSLSFTYIIDDPTFKGTSSVVDFRSLYDSAEFIDTDNDDEFRQALAQLPCCTTNKNGNEYGDPLNLVLIGELRDIFPAFIRRGWHGAEINWSGSIWRTTKSFMSGSRYRYSPVSPLFVYGRHQDVAAQKARGSISKRNHLRLWLAPIRFQGQPVFVGQISRDIGVKFTTKSPTISTHVIDPDVDEARRYLIEDLAYSQALARTANVKGVGEVSVDAPKMNLVGDPWYTDGLRAVMFFEARPRTLDNLEIMTWD